MKKQKEWKRRCSVARVTSLLLALCMVVGMGSTVFATEGESEEPVKVSSTASDEEDQCRKHSIHNDKCEYKEEVKASDCQFTHNPHTAECKYIESKPEVKCDSECTQEEIVHVEGCTDPDGGVDCKCTEKQVIHSLDCAYTPAVAGSACTFPHTHDADCGYRKAEAATPCTYTHAKSCETTEITLNAGLGYFEPEGNSTQTTKEKVYKLSEIHLEGDAKKIDFQQLKKPTLDGKQFLKWTSYHYISTYETVSKDWNFELNEVTADITLTAAFVTPNGNYTTRFKQGSNLVMLEMMHDPSKGPLTITTKSIPTEKVNRMQASLGYRKQALGAMNIKVKNADGTPVTGNMKVSVGSISEGVVSTVDVVKRESIKTLQKNPELGNDSPTQGILLMKPVDTTKPGVPWLIVNTSPNGSILTLLKKDLLQDSQNYNQTNTPTTWAQSSLNTYLNTDYLSTFSQKQQDIIIAFDEAEGGTELSKIVVPSIDEARAWFETDFARQAKPFELDWSTWWLRSLDAVSNQPSIVSSSGNIISGNLVNSSHGVRPALKIAIDPTVSDEYYWNDAYATAVTYGSTSESLFAENGELAIYGLTESVPTEVMVVDGVEYVVSTIETDSLSPFYVFPSEEITIGADTLVNKAKSPQTGDVTNGVIPVFLLVAVGGMCTLFLLRRRVR